MNNNQDVQGTNLQVSISTLSDIESTNCGSYTPTTIKKLIRDLANTPIPLTSCVYRLAAQYINEDSIRMYILSDGGAYEPTQHHNATFYITHRTCHKCATDKCAKNIATGKCNDEYIRNTLGTTLFPKYYEDKQR